MVAVGVVQYAPIVTCQRMVGRIPGGGGLQAPGAASIGAVESGLLATVLTRTHAGPPRPRRGSHACRRRAGKRPLREPRPRRSPWRSSAYLALEIPVSSALTHELTACSRSGRAHGRPREGHYYFHTTGRDGWLAQAGPDELTEDYFDVQPASQASGAGRRQAPGTTNPPGVNGNGSPSRAQAASRAGPRKRARCASWSSESARRKSYGERASRH